MQRCADCKNVSVTVDEDDGERTYECGLVMPFWVSLPVADYGRWVGADDGGKCNAFKPRIDVTDALPARTPRERARS